VARPHVSDRAQPDQDAGVATESLDGSGSPQSQQQPHTLAPDLPVLTCWVASHVTPSFVFAHILTVFVFGVFFCCLLSVLCVSVVN